MPTEEDNVQFLYMVLTNSGPPTISWPAIAPSLGISIGSASERWSRLKEAMDAGKPGGPQSLEMLWAVYSHQKSITPDWESLAAKCDTTPGAASKRFSLLKQAYEGNPSTPSPEMKAKGQDPRTPSPEKKAKGQDPRTPSPKKETKGKPSPSSSLKRKRGIFPGENKYYSDANQSDDVWPMSNEDEEKRAREVKRARKTINKGKGKEKDKGKDKGDENDEGKTNNSAATSSTQTPNRPTGIPSNISIPKITTPSFHPKSSQTFKLDGLEVKVKVESETGAEIVMMKNAQEDEWEEI